MKCLIRLFLLLKKLVKLLFTSRNSTTVPLAPHALVAFLIVEPSATIVASSPQVQPIPLVSVVCDCSSLADLSNAAYYFANYHNGLSLAGFPSGRRVLSTGASEIGWTTIFAISDTYPISAKFTYHYNSTTRILTTSSVSGNTNASTITTDAMHFARAASVTPIALPAGVDHTEVDEIIIGDIQSYAIPQGPGTLDIWHGLTNYPQIYKFQLINLQTGKTFDSRCI